MLRTTATPSSASPKEGIERAFNVVLVGQYSSQQAQKRELKVAEISLCTTFIPYQAQKRELKASMFCPDMANNVYASPKEGIERINANGRKQNSQGGKPKRGN